MRALLAAPLFALLALQPAMAADPEAGAKIVKTQCGACHALHRCKRAPGYLLGLHRREKPCTS